MFADVVELEIKAGNGGNGLVSWRRERFVDRGGPDGGDGGDGGNVIFKADHNLNTLAEFRTKKLVKAEDGEPGKKRRSHGRSGEDVTIRVPVGTVVADTQGNVLGDLAEDGAEAVVAKGGKGGFGNAHFKSSTRQAPRVAEIGEPGESRRVVLELKTLADVGLVGLPNAGKSTLLSVVTNAKPEIADYPFTTLTPNLGMVDIDGMALLFADIPGLIEGASRGKGLGDEFLRHVERTAVLLHLVAATSDDVVADYKTIQKELKDYRLDLTAKPQVVVLTKGDALPREDVDLAADDLRSATDADVFVISSVAHQGLTELLRHVRRVVERERENVAEVAEEEIPTITLADDPSAWWIDATEDGFAVRGEKLEGFAKRTDFNNEAAMDRLRDILKKRGVLRELNKLGVDQGDSIQIAGKRFKL